MCSELSRGGRARRTGGKNRGKEQGERTGGKNRGKEQGERTGGKNMGVDIMIL